MSKINISFNNNDYSVDTTALEAASAELKSHLSSVMNGSGATIKLGGVLYNVDSAKLSTATNAFISHLGTISGSGRKVQVNGVEYNVDSTKVAGAVSELEVVLGGLNNPDNGGSDTPAAPVYAAGLYETGSNYTVMLKSWDELLDEEILCVENGVLTSNFDANSWSNSSASSLAGDLVIDASVTSIGYQSPTGDVYDGLSACDQLTSIVIPEGVTMIGDYAFSGCYSLREISLPSSLISIGGQAFEWCTSITDITIPDGVEIIRWLAFKHCTSLEKVYIGKNLTTFEHSVFRECTALTDVYYVGTEEDWNNIDIGVYNECLIDATIHYNYVA